ncbi:MAG: exosortase/archaeosortase family protein, partial [Opitutaceae bacterium]
QAGGVKLSIARMTSSPEFASVAIDGRRRAWMAAAACALAGAAVFQFFGNANRGYIDSASLFYWWGFQWVNPRSETEHGWLVLALAAGVLARNLCKGGAGKRSQESGIRSQETEEKPFSARDARFAIVAPLMAMVGGLALHAVGFAAQQARVSIFALLVFAWGVLRLGGGPRWGGAAMFPLGFLVFAIPISVLDEVGFGLWLRMRVVDVSTWIAHASGIEVLRSGTQLLAPDGRYNYDVAAACSGVRSLTALTALALLMGYVSFNSVWRRGVVLALCFPLVYVGNVIRIVAIILAAQAGGQAWGERAHDIMGVGVFAIVLGGVFAAVKAMETFVPEGRAGSQESGDRSQEAGNRRKNSGWRSAGFVAGAVVLVAAGEMFFLRRLANMPLRGGVGIVLAEDGKSPVELPTFLGTEWGGRGAEVTAVEREILPPDTGFSRKQYFALEEPAKQVFLSIVLSGRDRTSIHRPELCLVGQGWTIRGGTPHRFDFPGNANAAFPATVLRVQREVPAVQGAKPRPQLVAYWFVSADAIVATHWQRLARDAWNRVVHARADRWAYVLMQTDAADGEAPALARMQEVLAGTLPAFQRPMER